MCSLDVVEKGGGSDGCWAASKIVRYIPKRLETRILAAVLGLVDAIRSAC